MRAALLAAALVLGPVACAGGDPIEEGVAATSAPASVVPLERPLSPTGDPVLDAELLDVARAVESLRGHPFLEQVGVDLLDDASFRARLAAMEAPADDAVRRQGAVLEAVGALPPGFDLVSLNHQTSAEGVLGYYDPVTGALVVRGSLTPLTRVTLAHELTHALDDQWFPEAMAAADVDGDAAWARAALAEGSARYVEDAYRAGLPPDVRGAASAEEQRYVGAMVAPEGVPPDLFEGLTDVYADGLRFVDALVRHGGVGAVDAAFAAPPTSSEQVLHPDRFLDGEQPVEVGPPAAGNAAEVVASGSLGEAGLLDVLQLGLPPSRARTAADGWAGDAYVATAGADAPCLAVVVVAHTATDAEELAAALGSWTNSGVTVTRAVDETTVRATFCAE